MQQLFDLSAGVSCPCICAMLLLQVINALLASHSLAVFMPAEMRCSGVRAGCALPSDAIAACMLPICEATSGPFLCEVIALCYALGDNMYHKLSLSVQRQLTWLPCLYAPCNAAHSGPCVQHQLVWLLYLCAVSTL